MENAKGELGEQQDAGISEGRAELRQGIKLTRRSSGQCSFQTQDCRSDLLSCSSPTRARSQAQPRKLQRP